MNIDKHIFFIWYGFKIKIKMFNIWNVWPWGSISMPISEHNNANARRPILAVIAEVVDAAKAIEKECGALEPWVVDGERTIRSGRFCRGFSIWG
jgi:hypothetical protein